MKQFFLLVSLTVLYACSSETNSSQEKTVYNQDPYNDVMTIFYADNKTVKQTFEMKDSLKQGKAVQYYDTGEINTVIHFEKDLKQDTAIYYRKSGSIYRKTPYQDDLKQGLQVGYYENGEIMFEMPYAEGRPLQGLKEYNEKGEVIPEPEIVFEKKSKGGYIASVSPKRTKVEFYNVTTDIDGSEMIHTANGKIDSKKGKCEINSAREIGAKVYTSNRACYLIFGSPK